MRKVIITADDFGVSENINKGIIETFEHGVTSEINLMIHSFGSKEAKQYAKDKELTNLGLHLTLFNTDLGEKPFRNGDYVRALNDWSAAELIKRIEAEIKDYEDYFGKTPSHINGHKQLHFNPKVIDYVFDYAKKNKIYVRKWGDFKSETILNLEVDFIKNKFVEYNLGTSDFLFGFEYDFDQPENATLNYENLINSTPEDSVIEILFHPGYCDRFEEEMTSFIKEREADRVLLCSEEFKKMLKKYKVLSIKEI